MNDTPGDADRQVIGVIDRSAAVGALERFALKISAAAAASRAGRHIDGVRAAVSGRLGTTLAAAVITHVTLMAVIARPRTGYWLLLPVLFAMAALILLAVEARARKSGE